MLKQTELKTISQQLGKKHNKVAFLAKTMLSKINSLALLGL